MALKLTLCVLLTVAILQSSLTQKRYDEYAVIRVTPLNQDHLNLLLDMSSNQEQHGLDFWEPPSKIGHPISVAVSPEVKEDIILTFEDNDLEFDILVQDLQSEINQERQSSAPSRTGRIDLFQYNSHETINSWLEHLGSTCDRCEVINIGQSYEGRDMKVLKIGTPQRARKHPAIWIDAGIHAREWIAPATSLYIINKLVTESESDPIVQQMVNMFDWYILPSMNPDGYEYSRNYDRMWRKTRSPNILSSCMGTDPNRNWNYHWMEIGASPDPCSETYGGTTAFSEVETQNVADFLLLNKNRFHVYLTFHSYGQYWLYPWGYTSDLPRDVDDLDALAQKAVEAIHNTHGKEFTVGSSTNVLYEAAGGSDDWAKGVAGIKYSYTVELRGDYWHGFLLPADQIEPQGEEMWAAMKVMVAELLARDRSGA